MMRWIKEIRGFNILQFCFFITLASCLEEKVSVEKPVASTLTLQLHNFNADPGGEVSAASLPDIFYFKQNSDDTYTFTLSINGGANYGGVNWLENFMVGKLDKSGLLIDNLIPRGYPIIDEATGRFNWIPERLESNNVKALQNPRRYYIKQNKLHYINYTFSFDFDFVFLGKLFSLDPNTGEATAFQAFDCNYDDWDNAFSCSEEFDGIFPTSDNGIIITALDYWAMEIRKFSSAGTLEFSHRLWEASDFEWDFHFYPSLGLFLGDIGGDYYYLKSIPKALHYTIFSDAHYLMLLTPLVDEVNLSALGEFSAPFDIELRLGPGKSQFGHRFTLPILNEGSLNDADYSYQNYVQIPFEVWDITNNRQLMVSFRDVNQNGAFDFLYQNPYEFIFIHDYPYSASAHPSIAVNAGHSVNRVALLKGGLKGSSSISTLNSRNTVFRLTREQNWSSVILKVNSSGVTRVKSNVINVSPEHGKLHKAIPYKNGFAVLANAKSNNEPAKLILLDGDFNQIGLVNIVKEGQEGSYLMETNGNSIFVASGERTINLTVYRDGLKIERNLGDFINTDKIKLETFTITPTNSGGVALLAWIKQSINTRDLLFLELDKNLNVIKK
jgi:hypothetical protein